MIKNTHYNHHLHVHVPFFFSPNDLQLEDHVQTAMILSLCGIASISMNQWNTTLENNNDKLHTIINGK